MKSFLSGDRSWALSVTYDGKQYVAVQTGCGVDAERVHKSMNGIRVANGEAESPVVPEGGVLSVFSLP